MNFDIDTVSGWFILSGGCKVHARCPACHSPRISYHKVRRPGLTGISPASKGLTPACMDCGKSLPNQQVETSPYKLLTGNVRVLK